MPTQGEGKRPTSAVHIPKKAAIGCGFNGRGAPEQQARAQATTGLRVRKILSYGSAQVESTEEPTVPQVSVPVASLVGRGQKEPAGTPAPPWDDSDNNTSGTGLRAGSATRAGRDAGCTLPPWDTGCILLRLAPAPLR
jgi:hypothetical protein